MKRIALLLLFGGITLAYSQGVSLGNSLPSLGGAKVVFVNTKFIMSKVPAYRTAQSYLDKLATSWEKELDKRKNEYEEMLTQLEVDKVLLPENLVQRRKEMIEKKITQYKQLKEKYFGVGGEYSKKQESLMKPILNDMNRAVQELAKSAKYVLVQDLSEPGIIYANPKYDISERVLKKMGYQ